MNFFSPIYFDTVRMRANGLLMSLVLTLDLKKDEFKDCCESGKAREADEILTENITKLMHMDNIQLAMGKLVDKFPKLNINLSNAVSIKDKVIVIGEHTDEMLAIIMNKKAKDSTRYKIFIKKIKRFWNSRIKGKFKGKYRVRRSKKSPDITPEDEKVIKIIKVLSKIYNTVDK